LEKNSVIKFNRIFLHAGAVKTGSTAFQMTGIMKHDDLRNVGIIYPIGEEAPTNQTISPEDNHTVFTSGNLNQICNILTDNLIDDKKKHHKICEKMRDLIGKNVSSNSNLVLSSENLFWLNEAQLSSLLAALKNFLMADGRIILVLCVRDIYEHALSWWGHMVRRHALPADRAHYLQTYYENMQYDFIYMASKLFQQEDIMVVKYQSKMTNLWLLIATSVGINLPFSNGDIINKRFNCSLDLNALSLLQRISKILPEGLWDADFSGSLEFNSTFTLLGDTLADLPKGTAELYRFPESQLSAIEENLQSRFSEQLHWINSNFTIIGGPLKLVPWTDETRSNWINADVNSQSHIELDYSLLILKDIFQNRLYERCFQPEDRARIDLISIISSSGVFDSEFYLQEINKRYHGKARPSRDVHIAHFLKFGLSDLINPSLFFDISWYLNRNVDLIEVNPVLHYVESGAREGRSPHPFISRETALRYRYKGNLVALLNMYYALFKDGTTNRIPPDLLKIIQQASLQ